MILSVEELYSMEHKLTVTLPDEIYQPLIEAALKQGRTPEEILVERLARSVPQSHRNTSELGTQTKPDSLEQLFGSISLGHPTGADNESIDRDLAREYGATHGEEE